MLLSPNGWLALQQPGVACRVGSKRSRSSELAADGAAKLLRPDWLHVQGALFDVPPGRPPACAPADCVMAMDGVQPALASRSAEEAAGCCARTRGVACPCGWRGAMEAFASHAVGAHGLPQYIAAQLAARCSGAHVQQPSGP
jgi:hypothetical protein